MDRPKRTLPAEPIVASLHDIELALEELAWLDREALEVKADTEKQTAKLLEKVAAIKVEAEERLQFGPKSARVKFSDRFAALSRAVIDFAREAKAQVLEGLKVKTRKFLHGSIAYREQQPKLEPASDEMPLSEALDDFLERSQVELHARNLLRDFGTDLVPADVPVSDLIDVSFTWNARRIKELHDQKRLTTEHLAALGLKVETPEEKITITAL